MKLYKYLSKSVSPKFLEDPWLRITPRSGLNDPFEVSITETTTQSLGQLAIAHNNPLGNGFARKLSEFMDGHGVISLTESPDNLLMWSHYAEDHQGIVIELDIDKLDPFQLFNVAHIATSSDAMFDKVNYRKKRPYNGSFMATSVQEISKHYYLTKSDEWMYEKEWRYIIPFTSANRVYVDTKNEEGMALLKQKGIDSPKIENGIFNASTLFEGSIVLDNSFWEDVFRNSNENGFIFGITLAPRSLNKLILGLNTKIDALKQSLQDSDPKIFWSSYDQKFLRTVKAEKDPDRFEVFFNEYK
ncbi:DUF2971 domain-containing protein [Marinomonas rhizomae]|uniref:DUF2971 family protein n=1 Tax=Marinomonas rhizomae TaxID=491948 RepID=A0A366JFW2_9GAMM|nr:DUF2971 domain-containing protein [Marinomonas rhizomae]RBP85195.1 DUF2971 family protein [Marinomonas rhizomae]RNF76299.1 DUF2971 domain-containing protein [Marinomonas rhizomae]